VDICFNSSISVNHTDMAQFIGASDTIVRGNLFLVKSCGNKDAQMLGGFDGLDHNLYENNVIWGSDRPWTISIYSDVGSIVRHNTLEDTGRIGTFNQPVGQIEVTAKNGGSPWPSGNDSGTGTQIYDNIADAVALNPSRADIARQDHNLLRRILNPGSFPNDIQRVATSRAPGRSTRSMTGC
jgi:hypothetical protein